ncbi:MAG: DNA methyltransferase [Solirubrobacteraceae bacterium]
MAVLSSELRKDLEKACVRGRRASEKASRAAIGGLGVADNRPPAHLRDEDRNLRRALCAKRDQLGDPPDDVDLLVADCAYEQWHRLLFARFLAENGLLIHPEFKAPVTLAECDDLAVDLGEPDAWAVAGRFAAEILPGIFRLDDPCVRLRLAPEGRLELEQIVEGIPAETFAADDALGWVYQHWQKERKDEVNASGRKIGGADLAPVTQLFTENYMVRFLLENSLGAWWASRRPNTPLVREWKYLRFDDDGKPAAGAFDGWPAAVAEVTVMDPCCGSGHFLVEAFGMLWRMRAEEEALAPIAAQDAVLRENLFGLELDPRCVQIAMFAIAVAAWKAGGGWRDLPVPNVACSGMPVRAEVDGWRLLETEDERLRGVIEGLYRLFQDADTLGSLIDPIQAAQRGEYTRQATLDDVEWSSVVPLIGQLFDGEAPDPATAVFGESAAGAARAADLLSGRYTLVATNVPYLQLGNQGERLRAFLAASYTAERADLATAFMTRCHRLVHAGGCVAAVSPRSWTTLKSFREFRLGLLSQYHLRLVASLGDSAFSAISGAVVNVVLTLVLVAHPDHGSDSIAFNLDGMVGADGKAHGLRSASYQRIQQSAQLDHPDSRILTEAFGRGRLLEHVAQSFRGLGTTDQERFVRRRWELPEFDKRWQRLQTTPAGSATYSGCTDALLWEGGHGTLERFAKANQQAVKGTHRRGNPAWHKSGVIVSQMGDLPASPYRGDLFDSNAAVIVPNDPSDLEPIWAFCSSGGYPTLVRIIDKSIKVTSANLLKVPFDIEHWREVAEAAGALPDPHSDDPSQWLFNGRPDGSTEPLQVAVARLLGYRWPEQPEEDGLNAFADADGIVCLPSVLGEATAADRLHQLLARAFGGTWSPARASELLAASGAKKTDLGSWLRDEFFKAHCQVFKNRPFVWHVSDGRKDGFAALVNYHRLERPTLERLTYTYLGDWIERQIAGARENVLGAAERLMAARELKQKLELILVGEPPYDIYVRWKPLVQQAIGWAPDLDDGVRLNVRPFVKAGVLRAKFNVKWEKDRGKNPDGSERHNDVHLTNAEKQAARGA